jgi:hypothetical protein
MQSEVHVAMRCRARKASLDGVTVFEQLTSSLVPSPNPVWAISCTLVPRAAELDWDLPVGVVASPELVALLVDELPKARDASTGRNARAAPNRTCGLTQVLHRP